MFTNRPAMKREAPIISQQGQTRYSDLENDFYLIRDAVQKKLLSDNQDGSKKIDPDQLKSKVENCYNAVLEEENFLYNHSVRQQMLD
jgi:hypothetical protein